MVENIRTMILLHTSDWHLGQTFFGFDREIEHEHFLEWLLVQAQENSADVLLIAGDVFDVSNPSAAAQRMFYEFVQKVTSQNPSLQVVIIAGNHDSPYRIEAPLPLVADKNVVIKGVVPKLDNQILYDELIVPLKDRDGVVGGYCLAVPYLRQGDYPKVESENPYNSGVNELYEELYRRVNSIKKTNQAIVAMGHLQALGSDIAKIDHSEKMVVGGLEGVNTGVFKKFDYTALGHIHKAQRLAKTDSIRYAGSPLAMSFAEKNYKHGIVKVVLDGSETISIEKIDYKPLVDLLSIPSNSSSLISEVFEELEKLPKIEENEDRKEQRKEYPYLEVKVRLTEPEPLLAKKIGDVLENRQVRLARIVNDFVRKDADSDEEIITKGLSDLGPFDIASRYYQNTYNSDMPSELKELFREVCANLTIGGGNK